MTRWDLKKTFTHATHDEFSQAVRILQNELSAIEPTNLEIVFYGGLPSATTTYEPWIAAANEADRQSKVIAKISDLKYMTRELWDSAVYVEARLTSENSYGVVEAKGLLPRRLTFFLQSNNPAIATESHKESVQKRFPGWRRGDGFFSYHYNVSIG